MKRVSPENFQKMCALMLSGEFDDEDVQNLLMLHSGQGSLQTVVDTSEKSYIQGVLRAHHFDYLRAAEVLGISSTTLWRKMRRLGLNRFP